MVDNADTLNIRETSLETEDQPIGRWPLRMAGLLLVLALVVQLFYYGEATLSPQGALCLWWQQGCSSNDQQSGFSHADLQSINLVKGEVQRHPIVANALLIDGTIINRALQPQRYPALEVQFFDLAGKVKAARRFRPEEYLPDNVVIKQGMPPGEPIALQLEILDPGLSVLSFQFNLY